MKRSAYILVSIRTSARGGSKNMPKHLLRPLLIVEFLIALEAIYTTWSEVGGQIHLDLMFWPWKLGIGFGAAWLITAITGNIVKNGGEIKRRVVIYVSLLCLVLATAGVVTWYYHMHEPVDQQEDGIDDEDDSITPAKYAVYSRVQNCHSDARILSAFVLEWRTPGTL